MPHAFVYPPGILESAVTNAMTALRRLREATRAGEAGARVRESHGRLDRTSVRALVTVDSSSSVRALVTADP